MATPLIITYFGPPEHKHPVKVMPMAPLRPAFEEACKRFKLDPSAHALALPAGPARRAPLPVELDVPFRLLPNVPSGARLEVVATAAAGAEKKAVSVAPKAPAAAAAAPTAPAAPPTAPAPPAEEAAAAPGPSSSAPPPATAAPAEPPAPAAPAPSGPLASLGVRQPVHVFHRRALEAQAEAAAAAAKAAQEQQEAAATAATEGAPPAPAAPPVPADSDDDDFYEFTAEDWALAQRAAERRRREEERPFTTQAQRDAAAKKRAESYGPVPVRLHYPDGSIVQAEFAATDTLFSVWELAARLASAELAGVGGAGGGGGGAAAATTTTTTTTKKNKDDDDSLPLYLYTAPPKVVVKDLSATLYQAGFVPAANLHVGSSAPSAATTPPPQSLRAEARALSRDEVPPVRLQRPRRDGDDEGGKGKGKGKAPAATLGNGRGGAMGLVREQQQQQGGGGGGGGGAGGGGAPKWLQMGRK